MSYYLSSEIVFAKVRDTATESYINKIPKISEVFDYPLLDILNIDFVKKASNIQDEHIRVKAIEDTFCREILLSRTESVLKFVEYFSSNRNILSNYFLSYPHFLFTIKLCRDPNISEERIKEINTFIEELSPYQVNAKFFKGGGCYYLYSNTTMIAFNSLCLALLINTDKSIPMDHENLILYFLDKNSIKDYNGDLRFGSRFMMAFALYFHKLLENIDVSRSTIYTSPSYCKINGISTATAYALKNGNIKFSHLEDFIKKYEIKIPKNTSYNIEPEYTFNDLYLRNIDTVEKLKEYSEKFLNPSGGY